MQAFSSQLRIRNRREDIGPVSPHLLSTSRGCRYSAFSLKAFGKTYVLLVGYPFPYLPPSLFERPIIDSFNEDWEVCAVSSSSPCQEVFFRRSSPEAGASLLRMEELSFVLSVLSTSHDGFSDVMLYFLLPGPLRSIRVSYVPCPFFSPSSLSLSSPPPTPSSSNAPLHSMPSCPCPPSPDPYP